MLKLLKQIRAFCAEKKLNQKQLLILGFLSENEIVRIKDISEGTGIKPIYMSVLVDSLEKKKLVVRSWSKQDRRAVVAKITKEGVNVWKEFEGISTTTEAI